MIAINIHFENFLTIAINKMFHFKVLPSAAGRLGTRRALSPRPARVSSDRAHGSLVCASFVVSAAIPATHRT